MAILSSSLARSGLSPRQRSRESLGEELVLALPRGGLLVAGEIAAALAARPDVLLARKLGVPWRPELAMGTIAGGSFQALDEGWIEELRISKEEIDAAVARETAEVLRREFFNRKGRPAPDLRGRTVLLVFGGLAPGSTMLVAARYVRSRNPRKTVIAVPVGSVQACRRLAGETDTCVCLAAHEPFTAVGERCSDFRQRTDADVQRILEQTQIARAHLARLRATSPA